VCAGQGGKQHAKHKQTRTRNTSKQTKHANKQTTSQKQDESRVSITRMCGTRWQATRKTQANTHAKHKQTRTQNTSKHARKTQANKQNTQTSKQQVKSRMKVVRLELVCVGKCGTDRH